jgi:hypothetical protein
VVSDLEDLDEDDKEAFSQASALGIAPVTYSYFNDCIAAQQVVFAVHSFSDDLLLVFFFFPRLSFFFLSKNMFGCMACFLLFLSLIR